MKNKLFLILCIAVIVLGSVISYFAKIPEAQLLGFAVSMFGAGLLVANMWKDRKPEVKSWLVILALVLVGLGSFVAGITGVLSGDQIKTIIGYTLALVLFIAGLITSAVANKTPKQIA
jgi:heme A synthase